MKLSTSFFIMLACLSSVAQKAPKTENVILVTLDGYRWQELFGGPQKKIYKTKKYTKDLKAIKGQYYDTDPVKSRAKLMPFMWGTIGGQGQVYGNKKLHNKVTLTNGYKFSYPGYNEILTGWGDRRVNSNDYPDDPNTNIFDFLKAKGFDGKMFCAATWDAFPRIINTKRNGVPVFVEMKADSSGGFHRNGIDIDKWQTTIPPHNPYAKTDTFTYKFAKEYIHRYHPRFAFIGFDETDDFAHGGEYDAYLGTAHTLDSYLQDLWDYLQSDPQYKGKTTLIVTCDHGRGDIPKLEWRHHGRVMGAEYIWIAAMGPGIDALGEIRTREHLHQNQIAATIAALLGYDYKPDHYAGEPIRSLAPQK
ncbi:MAG: alkaline phosphatase family protein [Bacteroidetes bacterium]|nr:alkaline phosphatase family protein [Bacteroidota bacterium]